MSAAPIKNLTEQQIDGLTLRRLRKRADLTQVEAADRVKVTELTWRRYEKGGRDLSITKLTALVEGLGFTRADLLEERAALTGSDTSRALPPGMATGQKLYRTEPSRQAAGLIVRDRVQAGAWLLADDSDQSEPVRMPAIPDPRYPHADQWLAHVAGDSVNKLNIFDGDLVQVVDAIAIGYHPRSGDVVEVERLRADGAERELTIKQIEIGADGIQLWPRSTNPRWTEPLGLTDGANDANVEVHIRGLVIGMMRRF